MHTELGRSQVEVQQCTLEKLEEAEEAEEEEAEEEEDNSSDKIPHLASRGSLGEHRGRHAASCSSHPGCKWPRRRRPLRRHWRGWRRERQADGSIFGPWAAGWPRDTKLIMWCDCKNFTNAQMHTVLC